MNIEDSLIEFSRFSSRDLEEIKRSYSKLIRAYLAQIPISQMSSKERKEFRKEAHQYAFARISTYKHISDRDLRRLMSLLT